MLLSLGIAVAAITVLSILLSVVERRRRETPMQYRCRRCDHGFREPPHLAFPRACPNCHATDWAIRPPTAD